MTSEHSVHSVHVWLLKLDRNPDLVERYRECLTADELERAGRLRSFDLRADFIYTRGVLRHILADFVGNGLRPEELRFEYEERGKPHLIGDHGGNHVGFNVSHSRDVSVFAVAHDRSVGVDVEHVRSDYEHDVISQRWFSNRENEMLERLPPEERLAGFFCTWARKEALVKALGTGISHRLSSFTVSVAPNDPAAILDTEWDPSAREEWAICDIPLQEDYAGAVVARGKDWRPRFREWGHE